MLAPKRIVPESGGLRAGQHVDQRGLAGAVGPDDADAVAALNPDREIGDDRAAVIGARDVFGFDDQLAGLLGLGRREVGVAGRAAIVAALLAQRDADCRAA